MFVKQFIVLLICLYVPLTGIGQSQDTIIDSHQSWEILQLKFDSHYRQTLSEEDYKLFQQTFENITLINVYYYGYDQNIHQGQLLCDHNKAGDLQSIFRQLFWLKFPIYSVIPISEFNFDDNQSMRANNTTCFDFRLKTLKNGLSKHAYGIAIDLNPLQNPFITHNRIFPDTALPFLPKGRIRTDDKQALQVINIFKLYGWSWGGDWRFSKDYMHFEGRK